MTSTPSSPVPGQDEGPFFPETRPLSETPREQNIRHILGRILHRPFPRVRSRTPRAEKVISVRELLRRHGRDDTGPDRLWHGTVSRPQVRKILRNMKFVADTYDLVVRKEDENRACHRNYREPRSLGGKQVRRRRSVRQRLIR